MFMQDRYSGLSSDATIVWYSGHCVDTARSILGWSPGHGNFPRMVALAVIMLIFFFTGTVVAAIV